MYHQPEKVRNSPWDRLVAREKWIDNLLSALRSLIAVLNHLGSASTFSHNGELTITAHTRSLSSPSSKAGTTATYLYQGDPSSVPHQRFSGQVVCRAPRGSHRHLAFDFEAFLPLAGPLARKDGGASLWGAVPLIATLETLAGWLAECEHDPLLEREHRDISVQQTAWEGQSRPACQKGKTDSRKPRSRLVCETTAIVPYL